MPDCAHLIPAYLRAVLHVVTSPLPGGSSTHMPMLPRGLRVLTAGTGDYRVGEVLTLDQACAHAPVVAVCGASGSGRSYLAHSRVAQETRTALAQIEDGAAPAQVRLPVLVAWSAWVAAGADDDGLLDAALAPLRDLGWDTTSVRRIHEILTGPRMRLLVVADGLDEVPAADRDGPVQRRLHRLAHRPHCELLVTGTGAAWQQVCRAAAGARVVRPEPLAGSDIEPLMDIVLPDDAERDRARALIESHRGTFATNVLLLRGLWDLLRTGSPVPDSMAQLRHRMLQAGPHATEAGTDHHPHRLIEDWRFARQFIDRPPARAAAVLTEHLWFDPQWHEVIPLAVAEHPHREQVMAQLAPPGLHERLAGDAAGEAAAREVDQFLLHLAKVSGPQDWSTAVREQVDAARIRSVDASPDLVAASGHWTTSNPGVVRALTAREPASADALQLAARLASAQERAVVLEQVLAALAQAQADQTAELAHVAVSLGGAHHERERIRAAALAAVPQVAPQVGRSLTALILRLTTTEADRTSLRTAALRLLGRSNPWSAGVLVELVQACGATAEDRQEILRVLLASLGRANPWATQALAAQITDLVRSADEREQALRAAADLLAGGNRRVIGGVRDLLVELGQGRPEVVDAAVSALPRAGGPALAELGLLIRSLVADGGDRAGVLQQVLASLPQIQPRAMAPWCDLVRDLARTETERGQVAAALAGGIRGVPAPAVAPLARLALDFGAVRAPDVTDVLLDGLAAADSTAVAELAAVLVQVSTDPTVLATARGAVLGALAGARPRLVAGLAPLVTDLDGDDSDRDQALRAVLDALMGADPRIVDELLAQVRTLAQTPQQRQRALGAVLAAIPAVGSHVVGPIVALAGDLVQTQQQQAQALEAALELLPQAGPRAADALAHLVLQLADDPDYHVTALEAVLRALPRSGPGVVEALTALVEDVATTPELHQRALAGVLAAIRRALPEVVGPIAQLVAQLVRTPADRDTALAQVVAALPRTRPHIVAQLGPLAVEFAHSEQQRRRAREGVLQVIQIHPFLTPILRRLSTAHEWFTWLADRVPADEAARSVPVPGVVR